MEQDSNLRRHCHQIYSLAPLAAWVSTRNPRLHRHNPVKPRNNKLNHDFRQSWRWDSNSQPSVYKTDALPVELRQQSRTVKSLTITPEVAVMQGLSPADQVIARGSHRAHHHAGNTEMNHIATPTAEASVSFKSRR